MIASFFIFLIEDQIYGINKGEEQVYKNKTTPEQVQSGH
jgi:hypothetical protein